MTQATGESKPPRPDALPHPDDEGPQKPKAHESNGKHQQNGRHREYTPPPDKTALFFLTLYEAGDYILNRWIESYDENGRRHDVHDYKEDSKRRERDEFLDPVRWQGLLDKAEKQRANAYMGVCPRVSRFDGYDLSSQIRVVRCLWADVDHCSADEALARIAAAGLPPPTAVVNSGFGAHLYWKLDQPYLIDDVGDPPKVGKQKHDPNNPKRHNPHVLMGDKWKPILDENGNVIPAPECSPKALHIQAILKGIAALIGGDHTQDLARNLRVPGSLNRKNQRNGQEPRLCEVADIDPERRYPLSRFEQYASIEGAFGMKREDVPRPDELAKMKLKTPRTPTRKQADTINSLLNKCEVADDRSKADFNYCCWCVEHGVGRDSAWQQCQSTGKFQERGESYFVMTWAAAENKTRLKVWCHIKGINRKPAPEPEPEADEESPGAQAESDEGAPPPEPQQTATPTRQCRLREFLNYKDVPKPSGEGFVQMGLPLDTLLRTLDRLAPGWPCRVGNLLFVRSGTDDDPEPRWLEKADQLFAWILGETAQGMSVNPLCWRAGPDMVSQSVFYAALQHHARNYLALERLPHHPPIPRHYYMHRPVEGGDGKALVGLLEQLCPATDHDSELIRAMVMTPAWGGPGGERPAFLLEGQEGDAQGGRGLGKSTLAKLLSRLYGGHISVDKDTDSSEFRTRVLTPSEMGRRLVLLDNIKALRFSWAELEAFITADTIGGHRMYHGEATVPNTFTYIMTLNGAALSKDLAQRVIPIRLKRPKFSATWQQGILTYIDDHRWAIIGDVIAALSGTETEAITTPTRWAVWENAVLSRVARPNDCMKVIKERQGTLDDEDAEADLVRTRFISELFRRGHHPEMDKVLIPAPVATLWTNWATGERRPTNRASSFLRSLGIAELSKSDRDGRSHWLWTGGDASPLKGTVRLTRLAPPEPQAGEAQTPYPRGWTDYDADEGVSD